MRTTRASTGNESVAGYATLDGAERAMAHLVSLGFDEHDVRIAPRNFEVVEHHPLRGQLGRGIRIGAIAGAVVTGLVELGRRIGASELVGSMLPIVLVGAAIGLALGAVVAAVAYRRARADRFGKPPADLAPTRYELVVDRERDRARHGLARWWDPSARPAEWQQPA